ncbi:hypothetical protein [Dyella sp. EPa41]|uniref:hypothetical protein n=1 Tax=Dyella sp. EPa41 TaxID=1561194 RepID=UPI0019156F15|nr:hypothetical protein [Dyella sp. EPa41]
MRRLDVIRLLDGKLSPSQFQEIYSEEIARHVKALEKGGASAPVILSGEQAVLVGTPELRSLSRSCLLWSITKETLAYVIDALTLDPKTSFASEGLRETAMELADSDFGRADIEKFVDVLRAREK